jgi:hypothetical protein
LRHNGRTGAPLGLRRIRQSVRVEGLALRSAQPAESDFCFGVHEETMREYVEAMFGTWDKTFQRQMHDFWFDPNRIKVIELHGKAVGILDAESRPGHTLLNDLVTGVPVRCRSARPGHDGRSSARSRCLTTVHRARTSA